MSKELARSARALGRDMNFFGSKEKDFVIQTKGRVKINFGDKFIELFNGNKFTVGNNSAIKIINGKPASTDSDGFYFDESTGTLYLKIGDKIYKIFSNAKSENGFISYKEEQSLNGNEQIIAKENIGSIFNTLEEAKNSGGAGVVYIKNENKAYILQNGILYPVTNNTEINIGGSNDKNYYFDKTVTIDIDNEGLSLIIEGLKNYIRVGTEDNHTDIYQTEEGGIVNSNKSLTIQIGGKNIIKVTNGRVDFNTIIKALKGIITDEIYSSNYKKGNPSVGEGSGWGIWIDKETGESYLQVDNILTKSDNPPVFLKYQQALNILKSGDIVPSKVYIVTDYQNEWEITPVEEIYGEKYPKEGFNPKEHSKNPDAYDENAINPDPLFGIDRNIRPLILEGKSPTSFHDTVQYYYKEDSDSILDMRYDIKEDNYSIIEEELDNEYFDISSALLEFPNKGRIYYARDSWNNEAPCDFKHFINADGKYIFTSPDGKDLSSMNTIDSVVCSNNKILDVTIRISENINSMVITGKKINSNTIGGSFENVSIGDEDSTIEYNYFNGEIKNCNFIGTFTNNSIGCLMDSCEFKGDVINNEFNKDIKNCTFNEEVKDNVFDMSMEDCIFGKLYSNQLTGSMKKCETYNEEKPSEFRENQMMGDFSECTWLGNVYSNDMKVDTVNKCTFKKDMFGNQMASSLWEENTFKDTLKFNIFQADVVKFLVEGLLNNNQFIGRINDVSFFRDLSNKDYGINNNIINGTFDTCKIYVDFSHNTITGPIHLLTANVGETYIGDACQFNYNDIKVASIYNVTTNGDFRRNNIKAQYFGPCTFNNVFECNNLSYHSIRSATFNKMVGCNGSGNDFLGTFASEFINCEFGDISNCTFRESSIKFAKFRNNFSWQNFNSNADIQDLEKLYSNKHQVDIFLHNDKVVISCQACQTGSDSIKGEIKMFNGLASNIPNGWHICDGTEGTPNLINKFIKGSATAGQTGGTSKSSTTSYKLSSMSDSPTTVSSSTKAESTLSNESDTSTTNIEPPYYTLIFIMKL